MVNEISRLQSRAYSIIPILFYILVEFVKLKEYSKKKTVAYLDRVVTSHYYFFFEFFFCLSNYTKQ